MGTMNRGVLVRANREGEDDVKTELKTVKKMTAENVLGRDLSEAISNESLMVHSISGNSVEARLEFEIHAADGSVWVPKNDCRRIALRKL